MNTELYRFLIALLNLCLIGVIAFVGYLTFRTNVPVPQKEQVPQIDPTRFAVKEDAIEVRQLRQYQSIWKNLRKPLPPPKPKPVDKQVTPKPQPAPSSDPASIKRKYKLLGVSINTTNPNRSTCYLKGPKGQVLVKVGEPIPNTPFKLVALNEIENNIRATVVGKDGKTKHISFDKKKKS